jgi:hypothetical protein
MNLTPRLSLLCIQLILVWFNVMAPLFMGAIMAMGWTQSQSHHPARLVVLGLRSGEPWLIRALGLPSLGLLLQLVQSFASGSSFCMHSTLCTQHVSSGLSLFLGLARLSSFEQQLSRAPYLVSGGFLDAST